MSDPFGSATFSAATNRLEAVRQGLAASRDREIPEIREAAENFEAVFLGQMLAPMFANISTDGPFGGKHAEKIYQSMMVDELGTTLARNGGIGVADTIYDHLVRLQEV